MREPKHECPHAAPPVLAAKLDELHKTQSGIRRHRCATCAYEAGREAGRLAAAADRRVTSWKVEGMAEMCEEGRSAPVSMLASLAENQGEHRWSCSVCAWALGWRDGVEAGR